MYVRGKINLSERERKILNKTFFVFGSTCQIFISAEYSAKNVLGQSLVEYDIMGDSFIAVSIIIDSSFAKYEIIGDSFIAVSIIGDSRFAEKAL
jgi:hypothetical protein